MKKLFILLFFLSGLRIFVNGQSTPAFWQDILLFKKQDSTQAIPAHPILFVGSSSFTKWTDVQEYFPGYPILNRGFGGSTLVDVIRYAYDIILPHHPKQVVIYCGENDLAASDTVSANDVFMRFKTLFAIIRTNLPDARIDFISIKPSPSRIQLFPKMKEANQKIQAYIKTQKSAGFINIVPAMLDASGKPIESLFVADRLHMKPEGYRIWQKIIKPYLIQ